MRFKIWFEPNQCQCFVYYLKMALYMSSYVISKLIEISVETEKKNKSPLGPNPPPPPLLFHCDIVFVHAMAWIFATMRLFSQ